MTEDALATRLMHAQNLLDVRRYEAALAEAGKVLVESPENYPAQILRARALLGAGKYFDALRESERAIQLQPENASAHCVVAQAAIHLHRLDRSDRATAEACRLAPRWAWAHYLRMRVMLRIRNIAAAKEEAALVLALEPHGSLGHSAQGEIALHLQAWSAAEQAYHRALERNPENPTALLNYGYALSRQGKDAAAIDAYAEAGRLDPRSSDAAQNIVTASQRHVSLKSHWRDRVFRLLFLVAWYAFGVVLAKSQWLAASAIGAVLLVGLVILIVAPYRRLRHLPEAARSALDSERYGSGRDTWSRRVGSHPLIGSALMIALGLVAAVVGYAGVKNPQSTNSARRPISTSSPSV